jgi:hypothetical protein
MILLSKNSRPWLYPPGAPTRGRNQQADPWRHGLTHNGDAEATRRHDAILHVLRDWIHKVGGQAFLEPRAHHDQGDNTRADIMTFIGPERYLIDVEVTHPTGLHHLQRNGSSQVSLAAAEAEATRRRTNTPDKHSLKWLHLCPLLSRPSAASAKKEPRTLSTLSPPMHARTALNGATQK